MTIKKKPLIEVRCPRCNTLRTIQQRHKYESTTTKVCKDCVPKVYRLH